MTPEKHKPSDLSGMVWQCVHDNKTLDVCEFAEGTPHHAPVPIILSKYCRCSLVRADGGHMPSREQPEDPMYAQRLNLAEAANAELTQRVAEHEGEETRLQQEVQTVRRYNDLLAKELRACSLAVGERLTESDRDLAGIVALVTNKVAELACERDDYKNHFEAADKARIASQERVAELESEAQERIHEVTATNNRLGVTGTELSIFENRVAELEKERHEYRVDSEQAIVRADEASLAALELETKVVDLEEQLFFEKAIVAARDASCDRMESEIAALKMAAKIRPMSEAPRDVGLLGSFDIMVDGGGVVEIMDGVCHGWLPCPPDTDKPDEMGNMHGRVHTDVDRGRVPRSKRAPDTDKSGGNKS